MAGYGQGAAEGLEQVLARFHLESQMRRLAEQDTERTRQWNLTHQLAREQAEGLRESREAEAARDRAAAEKDRNRQAGLQQFIDNPSTPPHLRTLLQLSSLGVNNVGMHDTEDPAAHAAHVAAEDTRKRDAAFDDFTRRQDYVEEQRRSRPVRLRNARIVAPGQDDPGLPFGSQRYIAQIRQKHPTFDAALAELNVYLNDPETQRVHPGISPQRAITALRSFYTGAGKPADAETDDVDGLINEVLGGGADAGVSGGGRGGGSGRTPAPVPQQTPATSGSPDALLEQRAAEQLRALGKDSSPGSVQRFLSYPANRQRLLQEQ